MKEPKENGIDLETFEAMVVEHIKGVAIKFDENTKKMCQKIDDFRLKMGVT